MLSLSVHLLGLEVGMGNSICQSKNGIRCISVFSMEDSLSNQSHDDNDDDGLPLQDEGSMSNKQNKTESHQRHLWHHFMYVHENSRSLSTTKLSPSLPLWKDKDWLCSCCIVHFRGLVSFTVSTCGQQSKEMKVYFYDCFQ